MQYGGYTIDKNNVMHKVMAQDSYDEACRQLQKLCMELGCYKTGYAVGQHEDEDGKIFYFEYLDVYWMDEYGEWVG